MRTASLLAGLVLLIVCGAVAPASADGGTPPPVRQVTVDEVNQVAKQLYCPVCENIPLDVCPTQACVQWRATIREKLEAGWPEQQVLDYFAAQYGERVLARPSTRGLNVLVWLVPPIALAAGGLVLWRVTRQGTSGRSGPATTAVPPAPADPYAARFEAELQQRR